ncbi:hypothetical protein [Thalassovita mangrovi]|nr:hypothetical protein [Thalassovita mangrovi]
MAAKPDAALKFNELGAQVQVPVSLASYTCPQSDKNTIYGRRKSAMFLC